jgi:hypothetical protein
VNTVEDEFDDHQPVPSLQSSFFQDPVVTGQQVQNLAGTVEPFGLEGKG